MVVLLKKNPDQNQVENLVAWLKGQNLQVHMSEGTTQTIMGLIGDTTSVDIDLLKALDIVEDVKRIQEPYKNANRKFHPADTVIEVGGVKIGGGNFAIAAGPCSVESEEQICLVAELVKKSGALAAARRRVQAPHLALRFSGPCARRASDCCSKPRKRPACPS